MRWRRHKSGGGNNSFAGISHFASGVVARGCDKSDSALFWFHGMSVLRQSRRGMSLSS
jgi:hypothetical protein